MRQKFSRHSAAPVHYRHLVVAFRRPADDDLKRRPVIRILQVAYNRHLLERAGGIEPVLGTAWKAAACPVSLTRNGKGARIRT